MRFACSVAALLLLAGARPVADPIDVAQAEQAFAAQGAAEGIGPAFRTWSSEEAIIFTPAPVSAKKVYAEPKRRFAGHLAWWPLYAGIARSGDLGFSTGPFDYEQGKGHGWFLTVWRKEAAGWRWLLDHGTPTKAAPAYGRDAPVRPAPLGKANPRPDSAWAEVRAAEAALAVRLAADARGALPASLWDDGRIMRIGDQPAVGRPAFTAAAATGPASLDLEPLGGGVSRSGDLAWTYGNARWADDASRIEGHYVRIWQRRAGGWRILIDEVTGEPPPKAPPPAQAPSGG